MPGSRLGPIGFRFGSRRAATPNRRSLHPCFPVAAALVHAIALRVLDTFVEVNSLRFVIRHIGEKELLVVASLHDSVAREIEEEYIVAAILSQLTDGVRDVTVSHRTLAVVGEQLRVDLNATF